MSSPAHDRLLPPNRTPFEAAVSKTAPLSLDVEVLRTLWNPWTIPAALLPWLAWALSVDEWDKTWDEATQRRVIAASIGIHRKKGSVAAVRAALTSIGHSSRLIEWWQQEPRGIPHTFRIEVEIEDRGIDENTLQSIERQVFSVKPVRSHFTTRMIGKTKATLSFGIVTVSGETTEVLPYSLTQVDAPSAKQFHAVAYQDWMTTTIYPQGAP